MLGSLHSWPACPAAPQFQHDSFGGAYSTDTKPAYGAAAGYGGGSPLANGGGGWRYVGGGVGYPKGRGYCRNGTGGGADGVARRCGGAGVSGGDDAALDPLSDDERVAAQYGPVSRRTPFSFSNDLYCCWCTTMFSSLNRSSPIL